MEHRYLVFYKNKEVGIIKAPDEYHAKRSAWEKLGYPCWKFASALENKFKLIKIED